MVRLELIEDLLQPRGGSFEITYRNDCVSERNLGREGPLNEAESFDGEMPELLAAFRRKGSLEICYDAPPVNIFRKQTHKKSKSFESVWALIMVQVGTV